MVHGATSLILSNYCISFRNSQLSLIKDFLSPNFYGIVFLLPTIAFALLGFYQNIVNSLNINAYIGTIFNALMMFLIFRYDRKLLNHISTILSKMLGCLLIISYPFFYCTSLAFHYRMSIWFSMTVFTHFQITFFFNRRPFTFYINTKISIYISGTNISWLYNSTSTHVSTRQMETLVQHIAINRTYHFVFISRICLPHNYSIFKFMD